MLKRLLEGHFCVILFYFSCFWLFAIVMAVAVATSLNVKRVIHQKFLDRDNLFPIFVLDNTTMNFK